MSISAYQSAMKIAETPRAAEHRLMREITGEMITAKESNAFGATLMHSLHRNREMWTVFAAACGTAENGLSDELRASIISLANWVDRHTSQVMAGKESIDDLLEVNRSIMSGLLGGTDQGR
ncbi:flagellar biosynthesis regulator FlaF [Sphingorhabdus sp. M41]|uniref:flagellar biosynthesis regulator FlaF n=1 Tax=Sphingorhabdus sp. M41 TaxID=1806885 RepID=UPI00078D2EC2|nr:flagellar biosynthesis regulator FlaF [Sphingorhabdus sp. M41]AMO72633.1 flagellar FlaF family protein [Sphingorhabdus sp. M41]